MPSVVDSSAPLSGPAFGIGERLRLISGSVKTFLFLFILVLAVASQLSDSNFISERAALTFYCISFLGLTTQLYSLLRIQMSRQETFAISVLNALFLCGLFWGLQASQSLFLLLLLVNTLLTGLELGVSASTNLALLTSIFYSISLILNSSVSQVQDLLSIGLFNISSFVVAALSGQLSEQLNRTQKAFAQSQDLLVDLSSRHRILIEELPLGLFVLNRKGEVIETNPVFEREFASFIRPEEILDLQGRVETNQVLQLERNFKISTSASNALTRQIIFKIRRIFSGQETYTLVLLEDVTDTRQMEADLKQKEKMAAVGTLAAGIAHEIRNPLAGMSGSIELLSVKPNTEEDQKLFKIILKEIDRLNKLVGEFLDYSKPEKKPEDKISLQTIVEDVLKFLETSPQKPAMIQIHKNIESSPQIRAHADKLRQAFLNIIINSFQAMAKTQGPQLWVDLKYNQSQQKVELTIRDNGSGMSPETKKKMFEPFHTTKPKGTGLGLAITHKILDSHGAQVFVESEQGQGAQFKLVFPCA
jgi:two-component system sensor histidine kinase PilS (NtrC family)